MQGRQDRERKHIKPLPDQIRFHKRIFVSRKEEKNKNLHNKHDTFLGSEAAAAAATAFGWLLLLLVSFMEM